MRLASRQLPVSSLGGSLAGLSLLLALSAAAEPPTPTQGAPGTGVSNDDAPDTHAPGDDAVEEAAAGDDARGLPEAARPQVRVALSPTAGVFTGDVVRLHISAEGREGDDITLPEQTFGTLDVVGKQVRVEPAKSGRQRFMFELELVALEPGEQNLPALQLRVVTREGRVGMISTEPRPLHVQSLLGNEPDAQPKAMTTPVTVMQDDYTLLWVLGGLLAAAAIAGLTLLVARYLRRRKRASTPAPPSRPPWEVALEQLGQLRRDKPHMVDSGQQVEFVDRASDAVRRYLGAVYGFEGLERTTHELLDDLKAARVDRGLQDEVGSFLRRCDLVKFAKAHTTHEELDLVLAKAFDLVRLAAPQTAVQPLHHPGPSQTPVPVSKEGAS